MSQPVEQKNNYFALVNYDGNIPRFVALELATQTPSPGVLVIHPVGRSSDYSSVETYGPVDFTLLPEVKNREIRERVNYRLDVSKDPSGQIRNFSIGAGRILNFARFFDRFHNFDKLDDPNRRRFLGLVQNLKFGFGISNSGVQLGLNEEPIAAILPNVGFVIDPNLRGESSENTFGEWVTTGKYPYRTNLLKSPFSFEFIAGGTTFSYSDGPVEEWTSGIEQRPLSMRVVYGIIFRHRDFESIQREVLSLIDLKSLERDTKRQGVSVQERLKDIVTLIARYEWRFQ